jgi:hypothetical protein
MDVSVESAPVTSLHAGRQVCSIDEFHRFGFISDTPEDQNASTSCVLAVLMHFVLDDGACTSLL